jgi:hypothetical protein
MFFGPNGFEKNTPLRALRASLALRIGTGSRIYANLFAR